MFAASTMNHSLRELFNSNLRFFVKQNGFSSLLLGKNFVMKLNLFVSSWK